jgi:hypothetical protein
VDDFPAKLLKSALLCSKCEWATLFLALIMLIGCNEPQKPTVLNEISDSGRFNVLLIVADDLNCDIGAYTDDGAQTPNLDRLATVSTVFENAHVQYPHCGPSRASFMTGLYPSQTKITRNNVFIRSAIPDVVTLGQRFRQQGYESIRIGKIFHYDNPGAIGTSGTDDNDSWDRTFNPYGRDKVEEFKINTLKPRKYGGVLSWLAADGLDEEQTDGIGATEAIDQLERLSLEDNNFFLAVAFSARIRHLSHQSDISIGMNRIQYKFLIFQRNPCRAFQLQLHGHCAQSRMRRWSMLKRLGKSRRLITQQSRLWMHRLDGCGTNLKRQV